MTTDTTKAGGADCEECGGTGTRERAEDSAPMECYACDGTGREPEPKPLCACYDVRRDGVIYPVPCSVHALERDKLLGNMTYRYQRYFDTEQDAKDRRRIITENYPSEAYGTMVWLYHVSKWWLVAASWTSAD